MHKVQAKGILSQHGNMNIYRGCLHGCIYCDSRSKCYQITHDFEDVEVKINAPLLLETTLKKKRKKIRIGTGAMSDPYVPLEKELELTRKCLEIIEKYGFGLSILTKSDLILRDLDILLKIHQNAHCYVMMTLTTADDSLCRIVEPNVVPTSKRVEVLKKCHELGIPTIVWFCPILPMINDTKENVLQIVKMCQEAGVEGILTFGMGMTLREGDREYYYAKLDQYFPGLKEKYEAFYGNAYEIPSPHAKELMRVFKMACSEAKIECRPDVLFKRMYQLPPKYRQLSLFEEMEESVK